MWSAGVRAIMREICAPERVEMEAGASSSFSSRRDTVTTIRFSARARERSAMVTEAVAPAWAETPSVRCVS